jgi:hypothetical protein
MAVTVTKVKGSERQSGHHKFVQVQVALDNAYPSGGYALTPRQLFMSHVLSAQPVAPRRSHLYRYDVAGQVLMVDKVGSYIVDETTPVFTAGAAYTLKYLPGYILSVRGLAGATGAKKVIPNAGTNGAGLVACNFATGVLSWGDAALTQARIVYIPARLPGFGGALQVVDEAVTLTGGAGTLANVPAAVQYLYDTASNTVVTPVRSADTPGAGQAYLTLATGGIVANAGVVGPLLVTYLKAAGSPIVFHSQTSRNISSNVITVSGPMIYVPAFGPYIPTTNAGTPVAETLQDRGGTAAANQPVWDYLNNAFTFSGTLTAAEIPLLGLSVELMGDVTLEEVSGTDLSFVTDLLLDVVGY